VLFKRVCANELLRAIGVDFSPGTNRLTIKLQLIACYVAQ
jgi:hypothetical protein